MVAELLVAQPSAPPTDAARAAGISRTTLHKQPAERMPELELAGPVRRHVAAALSAYWPRVVKVHDLSCAP